MTAPVPSSAATRVDQMPRRPLSLTARVTLTVVAAFFGVFAVLATVATGRALMQGSGELDRALGEAVDGVLAGVVRMDSDAAAQAIVTLQDVRVDRQAVTSSVPVPHLYVVRDGGGVFATRGAPTVDLSQIADGMTRVELAGTAFRSYAARQAPWRVVLLDASAARRASVLAETFSDLALYLVIALPFVLLPVWLSVRGGLAPLRRLSALVQSRRPDDMSPLPTGRSYRELLPLEAALNAQFARAAERIAREKAFVHDAAHELRTPLAVIATQAHLLAEAGGPAASTARQRLQAAVERASHLVQQLLRLARADAVTAVAEEDIDLMNVARDVLAMLDDQARAQGTELSLDGPEHAPMRGDPQLMRTIIANLVDNALRYGGAGGQVEVTLSRTQGDWVLSVADRGPGLSQEQCERAFERFWRAGATAATGSGLGLAIVRQVAHALGGTASLQARMGGGCIANVQWPAAGHEQVG